MARSTAPDVVLEPPPTSCSSTPLPVLEHDLPMRHREDLNMTGPEHYREAERLLAEAHVPPRDRAKPGWLTADELLAAAQIHATLALAAATADSVAVHRAVETEDLDAAWAQATS